MFQYVSRWRYSIITWGVFYYSGLLDKIETLLKYPNSTRADKIRQPKRVTIRAERIEKHKKQALIARDAEKKKRTKKYSRPLPPLENGDIDPILMTEGGDVSTPHPHKGRHPKHPVVVVN